MPTPDPETFDPWKLAAAGGRVAGQVPLSAMGRLGSLILEDTREVASVELTGAVDEAGWSVLDGEVRATVSMVCQRCLAPVSLSLRSRVRLAPVSSEAQAARVPEAYDPVVVEAGCLDLAGLVEDELILALPVVAAHPDPRACEANGYAPPAGEAGEAAQRRPFADLGRLLQKSKTEE